MFDKSRKLLAGAICAFLASCAHNGLMVIDGKYFGVTPSGFHFAEGFVFIDESRENSHVRAQLNDANSLASGASGNLRSVSSVEKSVGRQATGYLVDLAKEDPTAVMDYLRGSTGPAEFVGGDVETPEVEPVKPATPATPADGDKPGGGIVDEIKDAIEECIDGSCDSAASGSSWAGSGVLSWLGPVQAREAAADGGHVLVMRCASTCSNCAAVCAALDTPEFAEFCASRNVVLCRMYDDAKYPGGYRLASDYPDLQKPGFVLCRVLGDPAVCSFAPGAYAEPLAVFPGSLTDTAKKVEDEIVKCLN